MSRLIWSTRAQRELRAILSYYGEIADDLPLRMVGMIERAAAQLLDYPHLGAAVPDTEFRRWRARGTPFLLFYRPARDGVRILQVRHYATDWKPRG